MKNPVLLFTLFVWMLVASCKPTAPANMGPKFRPLQNGFGVVVQPIGIDSGPGAELYYKGTNSAPVLVWPHLGTLGYPILYSNDVAVLLAVKPDSEGRLADTALIAVEREGPAMDISSDVLKFATSNAKAGLRDTHRTYYPLRLKQADGEIFVTYLPRMEVGAGIPSDLRFPITWEQIFTIMEDVRRTGRTNKVTNTDVLYLQKDYGESGRRQ